MSEKTSRSGYGTGRGHLCGRIQVRQGAKGLLLLRKMQPCAERPYRAIAYPVLPALYILLALAVAVILLLSRETGTQALVGLLIVCIGLPVYLFTSSGAVLREMPRATPTKLPAQVLITDRS